MKLLIVESPTKSKKIASMLGPGWTVKASLGHIKDLPKRELGVDLNTFGATYVYREPAPGKKGGGGREVVKQLREAADSASEVYLGTDPDREGEAIAWHIAQELKLRNPKRVRFNEITKSVIVKELENPDAIDESRVQAQEARRVLDRLVGYRVSPDLSDLIGQTVSAGRVQTPALRLIVDREREIKNFVSREHYGVRMSFEGGWHADWDFSELLPKGEKLWIDREAADLVARIRNVIVESCDNAVARSAPRPAFTTSTMQQAASVKLKMNPEETMRVAQRLFESGHITYHRTDDPNLSDDAINGIRAFAKTQGWSVPAEPRRWKAKAGAQEAHEGIRPTHFEVEDAGESDEEKALYRLIRLRALASQLADALYDVRTIRLRSTAPAIGTRPAEFVGSGRVLKSPGWRAVVGDTVSESDDEEDEPNNPVPQLAGDTPVVALNGETKVKHTTPPAAYTQASLIAELEKREIGRPSTYATIVGTLDRRHYVSMDGKRRLHPTKLGEAVVDALVGRFSFADLSFTSTMETQLDRIAAGQLQYVDLVRAANNVLDSELSKLAAAGITRVAKDGPKCPKCNEGTLEKRKGKFGNYWSCDAWRRTGCDARFPDKKGKPDFTPRPSLADAPVCPECKKGKLVQREGRRGKFYGCTGWKDGCKATFEQLPATGDAA